MPRLVDSSTRVTTVVAGVNDLLAEGGIPALTLRGIAARVRISTAGLHQVFGPRERMLMIVAHRTGVARREQIVRRVAGEGVLAFLPGDDDDVVTCRAWLAWCELARSAEWLEPTVSEAVELDLGLLAQTLDHRLARPDLEWLRVVLDGLGVALCRPTSPMPRTVAHRLLAAETRRLLDCA